MKTICLIFLLIVFFIQIGFVYAEDSINIGVIGDSISDEYFFNYPSARNWVEILRAKRNLNFGEFSKSNREEPRRQGFEFNFARGGAITADALNGGQLEGIKDEINKGKINFVVILLGGNDFLKILERPELGLDFQIIADNAASNISSIISGIPGDLDIKILLLTFPDLTGLPHLKKSFGSLIDILKPEILSAIKSFNESLNDIADSNERTTIVDLYKTIDKFINEDHVIGNIKIKPDKAGNNFRNLFLEDGIHFGTVGQCLIANEILKAINTFTDPDIKLLTEKEIIVIAKKSKRIVFE